MFVGKPKTHVMGTSIPSILILFGILAIITEQRPLLNKLATGLIGLSLISLTHLGLAEKDPQAMILGVLSGIAAIGLITGMILKKYGEWVAVAGTLLIYLLSGQNATYFGYTLTFTGAVALLPLLGALAPVIAGIKAQLLNRWFGMDIQRTSIGINAFLAALLVFFAAFQAQYFGVVLVASGWLAAALASHAFRSAAAAAIAFLSLGFVFILVKTNAGLDDSFIRGNFLMGAVAGIAAVAWTGIAKDATRIKWGMMYVLPLLIVILLVMMGIANENFGGIPAYVGAVIGASIGLLTAGNERHTIPLQTLLIGLSALVMTQFAPREGKKNTSRLAKTETTATEETKVPDVLDVPAIPADPKLAGDWKSVAEGSKVEFQLGPEGGVTKGAVEAFDVRLKMNAAGEPEQLTVAMPTAKVTTFNPMRDESVLGPGYLDAGRFPKMNYRSTAVKKDGDIYVVSGEFEMLGKKSPLQLELKFAAAGSDKGKNYLVMVGKSAVDRTKFGMASDAKIGDLVEVTFEIELRK
jgi:polyisoprenoid-binding protein YceI